MINKNVNDKDANADKWRRAVARRRRSRRAEKRLGCFILMIIVLSAAFGAFYYYRHIHSPEYALSELQTAFSRRDVETIHKYVDFKALLPPNYKILTDDIFASDKIYSEQEHSVYQNFYAIIEPIITDGIVQSIDKYVQTGNWQRYNYDSMLKGRQLGIDYAELINRSLLFNIDFKEIKEIDTLSGDEAFAVVAAADRYTGTDFDFKLTLRRNDEGVWQVSSVENYQEYLNIISKLYREDINAYLAATKKDLDRSNAKFGQLQSEFAVLAQGLRSDGSLSQRALMKSFIENKIVPAYQAWYNYLQNSHIPLGARHLHELRMESASYSIQAWKKYAAGIYDDKPADLGQAELLHEKAMETEQKVTDTINNMPALFMPSVD